jgi:hypothetical protein
MVKHVVPLLIAPLLAPQIPFSEEITYSSHVCAALRMQNLELQNTDVAQPAAKRKNSWLSFCGGCVIISGDVSWNVPACLCPSTSNRPLCPLLPCSGPTYAHLCPSRPLPRLDNGASRRIVGQKCGAPLNLPQFFTRIWESGHETELPLPQNRVQCPTMFRNASQSGYVSLIIRHANISRCPK